MIISKQYSTPPHNEDQQSQTMMDRGSVGPTLWAPPPMNNVTRSGPASPSTHTDPSYYAYQSPSRRGSFVATTSPPSSPSLANHRPSPLEHRPDLRSSPWRRRDSLPSISQLTGDMRPYHPPTQSRPASLLVEEAHMRRHSIGASLHPTTKTPKRDVSPSSSSTSSTCPSPTNEHDASRRHSHAAAPYARSPELRLNHKMAERKRRKEMKDLFDDLRDLIPLERGLKTSKWEILSKAVGYIHHLHEREQSFVKETEELRREILALKERH
ncbi:hypothetical protein [Absidia glauca]|uniref:BHLH domain-containing protein n=1 Tax=Absidia glauca TaxID=4829 RepID=A0A163LUE2_ABSGL|nr:hypothetical protein [Absidia glauca]